MTVLKVMYYLQSGLSLTQAVDTAAVADHGMPAEDWATVRDVTPKAVKNSLRDAQEAGLIPTDETDDEGR